SKSRKAMRSPCVRILRCCQTTIASAAKDLSAGLAILDAMPSGRISCVFSLPSGFAAPRLTDLSPGRGCNRESLLDMSGPPPPTRAEKRGASITAVYAIRRLADRPRAPNDITVPEALLEGDQPSQPRRQTA